MSFVSSVGFVLSVRLLGFNFHIIVDILDLRTQLNGSALVHNPYNRI